MKLNSEIYKKAAELVTIEIFACHALNRAAKTYFGDTREPHFEKFQQTFFDPYSKLFGCDETPGDNTVWFGAAFGPGASENQLTRELALLFMAEMVDENGL